MSNLPLQNFVDKTTVVSAAWLNEVDQKRAAMFQPQAPGGGTTSFILGVPGIKFKATVLSRSNTTTLADDLDLAFTNLAPGTYQAKGFLAIKGLTTGTQGFKWQLAIPASTGSVFLNYNGVANGAVLSNTLTGPNTSLGIATIATAVSDYVSFDSIFTTTVLGNLSIQWAQNSSSANGTVLSDRSWLSVTQLA